MSTSAPSAGSCLDPGPIADAPFVTVIMPSFNHARFIGEAVASVRAQTYGNWELIISDDGSGDSSAQVIEDLVAADTRVRRLLHPHVGDIANLNLLMAAAQGEIIAQLDSDDRWLPEKLAAVVAAAQRAPGAGLLFHPLLKVTADRRRFGTYPVSPSGWYGAAMAARGTLPITPPSSGLAVRRQLRDRIFPLPTALPLYGDLTWSLQAAALAPIELVSPEPLGEVRFHAHNSHTRTSYKIEHIEHYGDCVRRAFEMARRQSGLAGPWPLPYSFVAADALCRKLRGEIDGIRFLSTLRLCPSWPHQRRSRRLAAWLAALVPRSLYLPLRSLAWRGVVCCRRVAALRETRYRIDASATALRDGQRRK